MNEENCGGHLGGRRFFWGARRDAKYFELLEVLSLYVPPDWQHGEQWAPEELKEGMRLHNVFAKRVRAKFERRLTVFGVPSFVTMWRTKHDANV
ncbi:hypothetical protein ACVWXN_007130 [Bradyrhizobium sp. i1.4.4]|uniref:hypothetical protein n=1 Tax=Bradyrhizobium sp. LA6.10 TaxID=3156318 RepID=UPI003391F7B9